MNLALGLANTLVFLGIACYTPYGSEVVMPLHRPNNTIVGVGSDVR